MATKKVPQPKSIESEKSSMSEAEERAAMQEQFKFQLKTLLKSASSMGIDLTEIYEKPPAETTVTLNASDLLNAIRGLSTNNSNLGGPSKNVPLDALGQPIAVSDAKLKPGQLIPGTQNWQPWSRNDLDPEAMTRFVPLPIPSLVYPFVDGEGRQKIKLDVNNLVQWLTVGEENNVNTYFYNVYKNAYDQWKELENFKRRGPMGAPWGVKDDGNPAWSFTPFAPSFGMTEEGRSIRNGPPTVLDYIAGETPQGPGDNE